MQHYPICFIPLNYPKIIQLPFEKIIHPLVMLTETMAHAVFSWINSRKISSNIPIYHKGKEVIGCVLNDKTLEYEERVSMEVHFAINLRIFIEKFPNKQLWVFARRDILVEVSQHFTSDEIYNLGELNILSPHYFYIEIANMKDNGGLHINFIPVEESNLKKKLMFLR